MKYFSSITRIFDIFSAGVGRTGTYIVVDAMLERAKTQKNVDIHGYMHVVRRGRIHMVQTEVSDGYCT